MKKYVFWPKSEPWIISSIALVILFILLQIACVQLVWQLDVAICVILIALPTIIINANKTYYIAIDLSKKVIISEYSVHKQKSFTPVSIPLIREIQYTEPKRAETDLAIHRSKPRYSWVLMKAFLTNGELVEIDLGGISLKKLIEIESIILSINPSIRISFPIEKFYSRSEPKATYSSKYQLKNKDDNHEEHLK